MSVLSGLRLAGGTATAAEGPTVVLRPRRGWQPIELGQIIRYRDLLWLLALRDIQVRYKQTILGALWAVIQPLVLMVVFSIFLGRFTGMRDPVTLYAGLLPWTFFANAVVASSNSLVGNAGLLRKVYFPRLIMPMAALGAPLVDYAIASVVLFALMAVYGTPIGATMLLLMPLLVCTTIIAALGVGVLLAAMTVSYRDFRYVVPFMIQVWFFVTPVVYDVPAWALGWNPMGGTIAAFRATVLGGPIPWPAWAASAAVAMFGLIAGLSVFSRTQRHFADVV